MFRHFVPIFCVPEGNRNPGFCPIYGIYIYSLSLVRVTTSEFTIVLGAGVAQFGMLYYESRRILFFWNT